MNNGQLKLQICIHGLNTEHICYSDLTCTVNTCKFVGRISPNLCKVFSGKLLGLSKTNLMESIPRLKLHCMMAQIAEQRWQNSAIPGLNPAASVCYEIDLNIRVWYLLRILIWRQE